MYMREARSLYHQWGAGAKVSHLENRYPQWFKTQTTPRGQPDSPDGAEKVHTTITQPITSIQMDLDSIISASQTLSAETDLGLLLAKMMDLVMANSGAEKAVLLLRLENDWFVQARSDVKTEKHEIMLNQPYDPADSDNEGVMVPARVFDYCRRSKDVLVVGDAQLDQRFAEDRMIQKHGVKSIACIPALNQGELKAMLYLENRQMPDVFSLERMEILQHLSSQFGVSVENALLFDSLRQSEERYELAVSGSAAGIWDWEFASDKVYYSDRLKELLGYAPDELLDTWDEFWNRLHPDDYDAVRRAVDQHLKERVPYIIDFRLQTKSGKYRWFHARGQAIWDKTGKATRMSGSITDIASRKIAEIELRGAFAEIEQLKNQLEAESDYLQAEIKLEHNFENIIGQSEALKYVLHRVEQVASLDSPVLIMGETGTGKELMARALHRLSPHGKRALVKVNCAALPGEGAFTGATTTQLGRFELAKGSTLFLDEIGELPLELQPKLLRVIESGEFERLGSSRTLHSDARIIAATNRVLEEEVPKGRFREDLWYRLKVFPITVPPLRERPEDIPLLVKWFVDQLVRKMGKRPAILNPLRKWSANISCRF
jgi:PAS domain S-box-containing protein